MKIIQHFCFGNNAHFLQKMRSMYYKYELSHKKEKAKMLGSGIVALIKLSGVAIASSVIEEILKNFGKDNIARVINMVVTFVSYGFLISQIINLLNKAKFLF